VLVDRDGLRTIDRVWRTASGDVRPFAEILAGAKREVLAKLLRLTYNEEDAADAWRRIYAFFDAELGTTPEASAPDQAAGS